MCYYFTIMFCEERQVKVNVITVTVNSTLDGWRQPPNSIHTFILHSVQYQTDVIISDDVFRSFRAPLWLQERHPQAVAELRD